MYKKIASIVNYFFTHKNYLFPSESDRSVKADHQKENLASENRDEVHGDLMNGECACEGRIACRFRGVF